MNMCGYLLAAVIAAVATTLQAQGLRLNSYAIVNEDGSLNVRNYTIRLYGIAIPPTGRTCRTYERPTQCGPRASLALDFKIGSNFVDCETVGENPDGSVAAVCRVNGEDLAAWMLSQGWAQALPGAPVEYGQFENQARRIGLGVWGFQVDGIQPQLPGLGR